MFTVEPIKPEHFDEIVAQESQTYFRDLLKANPEYKYATCQQSVGRTGRLDGDIIAICGIIKIADYLGEGWAYFSPKINKVPLTLVKEIKKFLQGQKHMRRIQCTVDVHNYKAIKFAKALGFKFEGILRSYGPEGHDHAMFTIINRSLGWEVQ